MNFCNIFSRDVNKYPLLTPEEETNLFAQFKGGDRSARQKIINHNLRLVLKVSREMGFNQDTVSEGCIGLMKAVDKFDLTKNTKFSTYATYWIRAYIMSYIMNNFRMFRVCSTDAQRKIFYNLNKERAKLEASGLEVTPEILAEKMNVKESDIVEMQCRLSNESRLDEIVSDSKSAKISFLVSDGMNPDEAYTEAENAFQLQKKMKQFSASLSPAEKVVFEKRMLQDFRLQQVGDELGVCRERVRQIQVKLETKLKNFCQKDENVSR